MSSCTSITLRDGEDGSRHHFSPLISIGGAHRMSTGVMLHRARIAILAAPRLKIIVPFAGVLQEK